MSTLKQRFAELQKEKAGITQADLARATGAKPPSVNAWFTGDTKTMKVETAAPVAALYGVNALWLATGKGAKKNAITVNGTLPMVTPNEVSNVTPGPNIRGTVPLLSNIQAGVFSEFLEKHSQDDGVEQIPTTVPVNRYTFALRVQGDSMEPKFTPGMLLIVEPELDPQNNDYVIVKNGSEETTFKQLVKDGDEWLLKPLNDRYPIKPLGRNTIVGVVRGVTEQFR